MADSDSLRSCSRTSSVKITRKTSWGTPIPPPSLQKTTLQGSQGSLDDVQLTSYLDGLHADQVEAWNTLDNITALGLALKENGDSEELPSQYPTFSVDDYDIYDTSATHDTPKPKGPFHKWMRTLHRRAEQRRREIGAGGNVPWQLLDHADRAALARRKGHKKSSSGSSFGFVTAVKSASFSLASASAVTRSKRHNTRSRGYSRSSMTSINGGRFSEDGICSERTSMVVDPAATERSMQRRRILEELISTEEGYIGDVKFLMNVGHLKVSSLGNANCAYRLD
jgi:hypothetical protein